MLQARGEEDTSFPIPERNCPCQTPRLPSAELILLTKECIMDPSRTMRVVTIWLSPSHGQHPIACRPMYNM